MDTQVDLLDPIMKGSKQTCLLEFSEIYLSWKANIDNEKPGSRYPESLILEINQDEDSQKTHGLLTQTPA